MKYMWTGTDGEASPLCTAGKHPVNQDGPLGVPESRPTPASPEEGHPQKAPISSSSSFCYRHWALMKQTKNKQNAPDLRCLSRNLNQTPKCHSSNDWPWAMSATVFTKPSAYALGPQQTLRTVRQECGTLGKWHTPGNSRLF